jgi:hypothetical protein
MRTVDEMAVKITESIVDDTVLLWFERLDFAVNDVNGRCRSFCEAKAAN